MARTPRGRPSAPNPSEMHRSWLELVESDGPFLAIPALKRVWPNGIPDFRTNHPDRFAALVDARKDFEHAWERVDLHPDDKAISAYREARDGWVQTVLRDVIGWKESLVWGEPGGIQAHSPSHALTIKPQAVLTNLDGNNAALVYVIDPVDSLRDTPNDGWAATPIDRLEELLRAADVPIGIVTDGRWWGIVSFKSGTLAASGVVDALTWVEEPRTRDAFLTILGRQYLIGGDPSERLPVLFEESIAAAEEITEALGVQVRNAVELLVQAFSESVVEAERKGLPDPLPERSRDVYEAAVTIMMRTVFLLFAEERGMLPAGELFEQSYGLVGRLDRLSQREAEEGEEALDTTSMTWHRLSATSSAIFHGATFENLRMPAYGGSLFDPARFPWLTATNDDGTLAVTVSDRVMLHVLRSVQLAQLKGGEARQISFRDIDVEQIGYIYEGLLGYTTTRVAETYVGLKGMAGAEPEIPLAILEQLHRDSSDPKQFATALREWVSEDQPAAKAQSAAAITKGLKAETDPSLVSALSQAVGGNTELRDRIKPFLGIIRQDLRSHPFVVLSGGLLVKETPSRKNAGAHYTPKSLAEEVVLHALQPLCYSPGPHQTGNEAEWKLRASEEILALKIADIACGSGAFLVASARYLADRVVEAWIAEDPENAHRKDLHLRAIRQVVANCLYGADINDMAVEMAKLSLWLVSLDRDLPFSFVDDKIFLGNSLLGLTSLDQLRALHIDPAKATGQDVLSDVDVDVDAVMHKAIELRERLASEIDEDDPMRSIAAKRRQYEQLQAVTQQLRQLADGVIAAGLPLGGKPGIALEEAYQNLRLAVQKAQPVSAGDAGDPSWLTSILHLGLKPTVDTDYVRWEPLHWVLEAPDVIVNNRGFDAVVGNPPFLGGTKISGAMGGEFGEWLRCVIAEEASGRADLVAFMVVRGFSLLRSGGTLGLIGTNTIGQGETREAGLERLLDRGFTISRAVRSAPWPARSANLEYAVVWGVKGALAPAAEKELDGQLVPGISSLLEPAGQITGSPIALEANKGQAFLGSYVHGSGFVIDADLAAEWMSSDPRNAEVLSPFLSGEDVMQRPDSSASRWVINFGEMDAEHSSTYALPWRHVERLVKSERISKDASRYPRMVNEWWKHWNPRFELYGAIRDLDAVCVMSRVSKSMMTLMVPSKQVFSDALVVISSDDPATLGIMCSEFQIMWAVTFSSTMRRDLRYSVSGAFETFPQPEVSRSLKDVSLELMRERERVREISGLGITALYNKINDPSVACENGAHFGDLRSAHVKVDQAVAQSYGWSDINLEHGFYEYRQMLRWTISPKARVEVLDRLREENQRRAALEAEERLLARKSSKKNGMQAQGEALF